MTTRENAPPPDGWVCESRPCPKELNPDAAGLSSDVPANVEPDVVLGEN